MQKYFTISDFLVDPNMREPQSCIPIHVVEKILRYHLPILNDIQRRLDFRIKISANSGYRSYEWEIIHGRSGNSEHTFKGLGAVDLTCHPDNILKLKKALIESDYSRIAWYELRNFFHCDFRDGKLGKRFYKVDNQGIWHRVKDAHKEKEHFR